jgi:4-carboxymuconolactone decarboxylase
MRITGNRPPCPNQNDCSLKEGAKMKSNISMRGRDWFRKCRRASMVLLISFAAGAQQPRFPQIKLEDTAGAQRALAERMLKETRAGLSGPWNVMLRSPGMAEGMISLYNHFRWKTALPQRLVEFGILVTAREWSVPYEWFIHYPLGVSQGLAPAMLEDLRTGKRPSGMKVDEAILYDFAVELLRSHVVSDETFRKAKAQLGEEQVVDLTALIGSYVAIGALLNVGEVQGTASEGPQFLPVKRAGSGK